MLQRVSDLEAELSSKSQLINSLNYELSELKEKATKADDLGRSVRDLQKQIDLAKVADEASQQKNAELKQTINNRDTQIQVSYYCV